MPRDHPETTHFSYNTAGFYSMRPEFVEVMTKHLIGSRGSTKTIGDIEVRKNITAHGYNPEEVAQIGGEHNYSYSLTVNKGDDSLVIKPGYKKDDGGNMQCHGAVVIKGTHSLGRIEGRMEFDAFYVSNGVRNIQRVEETFGPALDELARQLEKAGGRQRGGEPSSGRPKTGLTEADSTS